MKLSRASLYAIHAVAFLAAQQDGRPVTAWHVTAAMGAPGRSLLTVLTPLVRARLLKSMPGSNGGYRLARPASRISVLDVIEAADGPVRGVLPESGAPGEEALRDRLQVVLDRVTEEERRQLQRVKLSDLVGKG